MKYFVYIIESQKDKSYYIGYTQDLIKRTADHNEGKSKYTSNKTPWKLVHSEEFNTKREAIIREKKIKSWKSKKYIDKLIGVKKI